MTGKPLDPEAARRIHDKASVGVKWALPEVDSDKANRLRDNFKQAIHQLLAPEVFHIELGHALTRAERQARIGQGEAEILWNDRSAGFHPPADR